MSMYISDVFLINRAKQFQNIAKNKIDLYIEDIIQQIKAANKDGGIIGFGALHISFDFVIPDKQANIVTSIKSATMITSNEGKYNEKESSG